MPVVDIFGRPALPRRLVICTGPCCDASGKATENLDEVRRILGVRAAHAERLEKGSCLRRSCLGKCSGEPLAHVEPDGVWYGNLSPETLLRIYDEHVLEGRPLSEFVLAEDV